MEPSALDQALSEDLAMIRDSISEFARDVAAPAHERVDHEARHPQEIWEGISESGFFGTLVPEEMGGLGAGFLAHVLAIEGLARAGGVFGAFVAAQGILIDTLVRVGDAEVLEGHLESLVSGEAFGAPALMEEAPGLLATSAAPGGEGEAMLVGRKILVPHPGRGGPYLVRAAGPQGELLVLVERGAPGLDHSRSDEALGLLGFETGPLLLEDVRGRVLGDGKLIADVLAGAQIAVSALLCGVARGALDHAVRYANEREQFGVRIRDFTAIQERIARSDARIEGLRALVHGAAGLRDAGKPHAHAARRARLQAAQVPMAAAHDALQVFGGYGYSREYPPERFYRDARFPGFGEMNPTRLLAESMACLEQP